MSNIGWVYGILQGNGIDTTGMEPREAFAELEKLRQSGKVTDNQIKFSKSHSDAPSKTGNTRKTNASAEDKTTIKEQVAAHKDDFKGKKPIAEISGKASTDFKTAVTSLKVQLQKSGGVVTRKGFGDIQVSSRLLDAKKYLEGQDDVEAIAAIPAVIKKGKVIAEHENHKGRGYSTVTFAGKIKIGDKVAIMGVVVKHTTKHFYDVHRVFTLDDK